ncbi:MAG: hypothetical protein A2Y25_01505 [Candidatus Melainabacteria bacterium GWF2_37_15]|nr:MAG: hypothetical protein A2Y25_01505 [Candidatus Melainabacteria bacterium GWF2_37_15]
MAMTNKKILIGITGGIAAYKVCELIRLLVKADADVKTVLTPNAKNFVTETTLRTLTKNPVYTEQFNGFDWKPEHINLADEADLFVIAPASANTIGKIANGICDNLLTSLVAAFNKQIILAPAMNCNMWNNQFVQENVKKLENAGFSLIPPEEGDLACGYEGVGRLADINKIFNKICEVFQDKQILKGKKILVTAGGTKESIDPVRFIGNRSSGKMGVAIADAAWNYGAEVCLISTFKTDKPYRVITVESAQEMRDAVMREFPDFGMLIMAAAVADYKVKEFSQNKIKKIDQEEINIELVKNPDILSEITKIKSPSQTVVGFCAETENLKENAVKKLKSKNLDFIVANDVSGPESGFESDYNSVIIINKENNDIQTTGKMLKSEIAKIILKNSLKI